MLKGEGTHDLAFRFHLAPGLDTSIRADGIVEVCDKMNGARLLISARGLAAEPVLESRFSSRDYGSKAPSVSVCWTMRSALPVNAQFVLFPVRAGAQVSITQELLLKAESTISDLRSET